MKNVTWSSRFTKQLDAEVLDFSQSLNIDIVLFNADIRVTMAHIDMLASCGHISPAEKNKINSALKKVNKLAETGKIKWSIQHEDVHMNIENALVGIIGDLGKKIHLGRSRNDLVTTDLRLYLRDFIDIYIEKPILEKIKNYQMDEISITSSFSYHEISDSIEGFGIEEIPNVKILVSKSKSKKCQRCWKYKKELIRDEICDRCEDAIS